MSGPLPKGKITLAERPDLRQWEGPRADMESAPTL